MVPNLLPLTSALGFLLLIAAMLLGQPASGRAAVRPSGRQNSTLSQSPGNDNGQEQGEYGNDTYNQGAHAAAWQSDLTREGESGEHSREQPGQQRQAATLSVER